MTSDGMREFVDTFNGDNAHLLASMRALLDLDADGALVPHGIGGLARGMLNAAASRLEKHTRAPQAEAVAWLKEWKHPDTGEQCRRLDKWPECEPWLAVLNPTVTPLYTAPQPQVEEGGGHSNVRLGTDCPSRELLDRHRRRHARPGRRP